MSKKNITLLLLALALGIFIFRSKNKFLVLYKVESFKKEIYAMSYKIHMTNHSENVLTINLKGKHDSLYVKMSNAYPDLTFANIIAYDSINGCNIFFTGERRIDYFIFNGDKNPQKILQDLILRKFKNRPIPGFNYETHKILFLNYKIVNSE